MLRLAKFSLGSLLLAVAAIGGLGSLNLYTYHRFTDEADVATLRFDQLGARRYSVMLHRADGQQREFELQGDEWQLDVRMIKWTDWLTFLGESPLYQLDRISGRYVTVEDALTNGQTIHDLSEKKGVDIWSFARKAGDWLPGIDAAYGSSVYLPMADGATYRVSISHTGVLARRMAATEER